jgi:hypothetical protein
MSFSRNTKILLSNYSLVTFEHLLTNHRGTRGHSYDVRYKGLDFCNFTLPSETEVLKQVIEVELDSGELFTCSTDQRFLLVNGTTAFAEELHMGMSLLGMKSLSREREYLVNRTRVIDVKDRQITIRTVKHSNFALGCGVFVRPN